MARNSSRGIDFVDRHYFDPADGGLRAWGEELAAKLRHRGVCMHKLLCCKHVCLGYFLSLGAVLGRRHRPALGWLLLLGRDLAPPLACFTRPICGRVSWVGLVLTSKGRSSGEKNALAQRCGFTVGASDSSRQSEKRLVDSVDEYAAGRGACHDLATQYQCGGRARRLH
jgi:hypothetical protein